MRGNEQFNNSEKLFRADPGKESGDDFGLPKSGSTGGGSVRPGSAYKAPPPPPPKSSSGLGIILGIVFLAIIVFVVYWFLIRKPAPDVEPVVQDTTAVQAIDTVTQIEPEPVSVDTVPAQPAEGQIATINSRTGRYYVVISASIDADLANDYATKLTQQGVQCTILGPPIERKGYYKLSVADFESLAEASTKMEELKGTYGSEIWVLKY